MELGWDLCATDGDSLDLCVTHGDHSLANNKITNCPKADHKNKFFGESVEFCKNCKYFIIYSSIQKNASTISAFR